MKKRNKKEDFMKKRNLIAAISCFAVLCAGIGVASLQSERVYADVSSGGEYATYYLKGETLSISECVLSYNDQDYNTTHSVIYPDGKTVSYDDELLLSQAGKYTVVYQAKAGNKTLKKESFFEVKKDVYEIEGILSSVTKGVNERYDNINGLNVKLYDNETFVYNKLIDLNKLGRDGNIFDFKVAPLEVGPGSKLDAKGYAFVLQDAYDASKNITIRLKRNFDTYYFADDTAYTSYVDAKAADWQYYVGFEEMGGRDDCILVSGKQYVSHKWNQNVLSPGMHIWYSLGAVRQTGGVWPDFTVGYFPGEDTFSISYDQETKCVYACGGLVVDLDMPEAVGDQPLFEGFTTGEVFLKVYAIGYQQATANFCFTSIAGDSFEETHFVDSQEPRIQVDTFGYGEELPAVKVGKTYPVFPASATGTAGVEVDVKSYVYFDYYGEQKVNVPIKDGRFKAERVGDYYIIYRARNINGYETEKVLKVSAKFGIQDMSFQLGEKVTTGYVGHPVTVASFTTESIYNNVDTKIVVTLKSDKNVHFEIGQDMQFVPMIAGEYEVRYESSDLTETIVSNYSVNVIANDKALFTNDFAFSQYMIKGATYTLPEMLAVSFDTGKPVACVPVVKVVEKAGTNTKEVSITNGKYTVGACDSLQIVCRASSSENAEERTFDVTVVDVGYGGELNTSNYFQAEKGAFDVTRNRTNTLFETLPSRGTTQSLNYINLVDLQEFEFKFSLNQDKLNFATMNVYVIDPIDESNFIKVTFFKNENKVATSVNGVNATLFSFDSIMGTANLTVLINAEDENVILGVDSAYSVAEFFDKLTYGFARLKVEFEGITGTAAFSMQRLNKQMFNSSKYDSTAPMVSIKKITGYQGYNEVVTLQKVTCIDVLDPNTSCTMTVKLPSGEIAKSASGVALKNVDAFVDYELRLTEYGKYEVSYTPKDSSGNGDSYNYYITVVDRELPTVMLNGGVKTAKVGDKIALAEIQANDNLDGVTVRIYLYCPDGVLRLISGDYFVAESAGIYEVWVYVVDKANNVTTANYQVEVTEGN